jgi:hypothetical protein
MGRGAPPHLAQRRQHPTCAPASARPLKPPLAEPTSHGRASRTHPSPPGSLHLPRYVGAAETSIVGPVHRGPRDHLIVPFVPSTRDVNRVAEAPRLAF